MNELFEAVINEYDVRSAGEARVAAGLSAAELAERRDEFLVSVGPDAGRFVNSLVKCLRARAILELGSAYGYSTLWLADAARETNGHVTSIELSAAKVQYARERLHAAGLNEYVTFVQDDALTALKGIVSGWEIVFLDVWKNMYIPCFDMIYPQVASGGVVVADNMILPRETHGLAHLYRAHVRRRAAGSTVLLPIGNGLELTTKA